MRLSPAQREALLQEGYVRVPAVVPGVRVAAALKAINHSIGQGLPPEQMAHAVGANTSPHVRHAVYFRVKSRGHDGRRWECLTDLWREWPGLSER